MTSCMISQPRYLPALSYLQRIRNCDVFIILDTVQHNRQDFEHRNRIGDQAGAKWLSLPLDRSVGSRPLIKQLMLLSEASLQQHCDSILTIYQHADQFNEELTRSLYEPLHTIDFVSVLLQMLERTFNLLRCGKDGDRRWLRASNLPVNVIKGPEYLVQLCQHVGASHYVSGPNGKHYIASEFAEAGLEVSYHQDEPPLYGRSGQPAIPWLAWIDALHHQGIGYVGDIIRKPMTLCR